MKIFIGIISLLLVTSSFASEKPSFDDGILTIPSVDSEGKSGFYQDVVFQLSDEGNWKLQDVKTGGLIPIQNVEVIKTDSFPVQVLVRIEGEIGGCPRGVGQIHHQFKDNKFNIFVYHAIYDDLFFDGMSCTAVMEPFERIIALPVYDLKAGEYVVTVDGMFPRTFSFDVDNAL